jgi:GAF domain-containing protein
MVSDERWKNLSSEFSFRSMLAVPVAVRKEPLGIFVIFTSFPHAFSGDEVRLARSFADQSALLIKAYQAEDRALKLEKKLNERKLVDKAKGLLMERHSMTESEAYEFLRKQSMNLRKSLGEVAEAIITYAEIKKLDK